MLDLFSKILSSVVGQMKPDGNNLEKIEKDLFRKFDALEAQAKADSRGRWIFLFAVCALLALSGYFVFKQFKAEVKTAVQVRLDEEFSSAAVQGTIEDSARKHAGLKVKEYVDSQLAAYYKVAKLESLARLDSRRAYEELAALAKDPRFKDDAQMSLAIVHKRYLLLEYPFEIKTDAPAAGEGAVTLLKLDPAAASDAPIDALRPRLAQLAQDSQKNYLVPDFIRFLKESDSLGASVGICRILIQNYGAQAGEYDFDAWARYLESLDRNAVKINKASK